MSETIGTKSGWGKRGVAILVLIIGLSTALYYAWSWDHYYHQATERTGKDMVFMWQWKMYADGMKVAYAEDTYGGATPEETLQLFIDALKAGDIELASKYYIPEKQGEVFVKLEEGKLRGTTGGYVQIIESRDLGQLISENNYSFSVSEGDKFLFYIRTIQNPISKKWKISEP